MAAQSMVWSSEESPSASAPSIPTRSNDSDSFSNFIPLKDSFFQKEFIQTGELGAGGFGYVLKVRSETDQKEYAIKIVKLSHNDNDQALKEAKILSDLKHVNVVQYHAAWVEKWIPRDAAHDEEGCYKNSGSSSGTDSSSAIIVPHLFLKMELCPTSLRSVIDEKKHEADKLAHYFYQIVLGLDYIHSKGLIHRDINPKNIFIGYDDRIKIGDFGLAKTGDGESLVFSPSVGTYLYRAPEVHTEKYDKYADIYSLGVVFFEILYPLGTGMERAEVLGNLRTDAIKFPDNFIDHASPWHKEFLGSLLSHEPEKRPSLENILDKLIDNYTFPTEVNHKRVVQVYFKGRESNDFKCVKFDKHENIKTVRSQWDIIANIENIFRKYGASHFQTPLLTSRSSLKTNPPPVELMTKAGEIVCLPQNSRTSFAQYIVSNSIKSMKRFDSPHTFEDTNIQYHPKQKYECVLDIVTCDPDIIEVDAQMLQILIDVCNFVHNIYETDKNIETQISINHVDVVKIILLSVGVSNEDLYAVLSSIGSKGFRDGLNSLAPHQIKKIDTTKLEIILNYSGSFGDVENMLLQNVHQDYHKMIRSAFAYMDDVLLYLDYTIGVSNPHVQICINCCSNVHQYSGILFSYHAHDTTLMKNVIIADGGRYDGILKSDWETEETERFGCGITIYPANVVDIVAEFWPPELVVLTCRKNYNLEKFVFHLASILRRMDYNCDTQLHMIDPEIEAFKKDPTVLCLIEYLPSNKCAVTYKYSKIEDNQFIRVNVPNYNPPTLMLAYERLEEVLPVMFPSNSVDESIEDVFSNLHLGVVVNEP